MKVEGGPGIAAPPPPSPMLDAVGGGEQQVTESPMTFSKRMPTAAPQ